MTVSIICITHNASSYIKEAIERLYEQNYPNWELIVVDDGSCDDTRDIIEQLAKQDGRIKLFAHKNNKYKGFKESLKYALKFTQGPWLAFLEKDCVFNKDYFSHKLKIASANPQLDMIFSADKSCTVSKYFRLEDMLKKNYIPSFSNVMVKKHIFESLNFNSVVPEFIGWWLFSQVLAQYCCGYINRVLCQIPKPAKSNSCCVQEKDLIEFKNALFDFIFDPSNYFIPKMLLKLYLCPFVPLGVKDKILNKLHKINYIKASFYYFNN